MNPRKPWPRKQNPEGVTRKHQIAFLWRPVGAQYRWCAVVQGLTPLPVICHAFGVFMGAPCGRFSSNQTYPKRKQMFRLRALRAEIFRKFDLKILQNIRNQIFYKFYSNFSRSDRIHKSTARWLNFRVFRGESPCRIMRPAFPASAVPVSAQTCRTWQT